MNNARPVVAALLLVVLVSAAGCAGLVMTPGAQQVVVLQSVSAVRPCKQRGVVFALAPFDSMEQPLDQLKIRAEAIGADTVVLPEQTRTRTKDWSARAYRCGLLLEAARLSN